MQPQFQIFDYVSIFIHNPFFSATKRFISSLNVVITLFIGAVYVCILIYVDVTEQLKNFADPSSPSVNVKFIRSFTSRFETTGPLHI